VDVVADKCRLMQHARESGVVGALVVDDDPCSLKLFARLGAETLHADHLMSLPSVLARRTWMEVLK
jgi:hypothetical protein